MFFLLKNKNKHIYTNINSKKIINKNNLNYLLKNKYNIYNFLL